MRFASVGSWGGTACMVLDFCSLVRALHRRLYPKLVLGSGFRVPDSGEMFDGVDVVKPEHRDKAEISSWLLALETERLLFWVDEETSLYIQYAIGIESPLRITGRHVESLRIWREGLRAILGQFCEDELRRISTCETAVSPSSSEVGDGGVMQWRWCRQMANAGGQGFAACYY